MKAYVFGCGQYFRNKQNGIMEKYDIVAILDNYREGEVELPNGSFVPIIKPAEAISHKDFPIILMIRDFHSAWKQLDAIGIDSDRIIFSDNFSPWTEEEQQFKAENGGFRITDREIWYEDEKRVYLINSTESLFELPKRLERDRIDASFLTKQASVRPLNREFGFSRGTPIDRYYIEKWLKDNKNCIRGDVLEIAEDTYTKRFGGNDVRSHILHVSLEKAGVIKGNLETGEGIVANSMDCIILTQTLPFIFNSRNVFLNLYKMLRKGGCALVTAGGIGQISRYDMDHWGHFWSFTTASLERLMEESGFGTDYEMTVYGNVKTACALLYGVSAEELKEEELLYKDEDYPVSHCVLLRK